MFAGMGRIHAARILVSSLPDQLTGSSVNGELLGYIKFFGVWDATPVLADVVARNPGEGGTKAEKKAWENEYKVGFRMLDPVELLTNVS